MSIIIIIIIIIKIKLKIHQFGGQYRFPHLRQRFKAKALWFRRSCLFGPVDYLFSLLSKKVYGYCLPDLYLQHYPNDFCPPHSEQKPQN